jgi:hypothetical protein
MIFIHVEFVQYWQNTNKFFCGTAYDYYQRQDWSGPEEHSLTTAAFILILINRKYTLCLKGWLTDKVNSCPAGTRTGQQAGQQAS